MIDPIQLPLLLKAIDFVFEEGHKILEERRERRRNKDNPQSSENLEPAEEIAPVEIAKKNEIKQELLTSKVDEILWQNHQMEIQHLVKLLETYSRNYHLTREQYAKWGDALVPSIIVHNMQEAESSVIETMKQLEIILEKVYNKDIHSIK